MGGQKTRGTAHQIPHQVFSAVMLSPAAGHTFFCSNSQCQHLRNFSAFSAKILGVHWAPGTHSQALFHYGRQHLFFLWLILLIFVCVSYHITFEEIMSFLLLWRKRGWNLKLAPSFFKWADQVFSEVPFSCPSSPNISW